MSEKKPFLLKPTKITATSVNNSYENRGKDGTKVLLKSIDVEMEASAKVLEQLATHDSIDYQSTFFDDDGTPKDLGMGRVPYQAEFNDQIVIISADNKGEINAYEFQTKKIHKFAATFSPGKHVKLHLQFQVYPDSELDGWFLDRMPCDQLYLQICKGRQMDLTNEAA